MPTPPARLFALSWYLRSQRTRPSCTSVSTAIDSMKTYFVIRPNTPYIDGQHFCETHLVCYENYP
jgi:hypothetical protein